jgi:hypothetical protein
MKVVHLWAGEIFHEEGYIVGNKEGLEALRRAIDYAIVNSDCDMCDSKTFHISTCDGEGYDIHVVVTKNTDEIALPYTHEYATERRDNALYPWQMVEKIKGQPKEDIKV